MHFSKKNVMENTVLDWNILRKNPVCWTVNYDIGI